MKVPDYFNLIGDPKPEESNEIQFENWNNQANKFVKGRIRSENELIKIDVLSSNYSPSYLKRKLKREFPQNEIIDIRIINYAFHKGNQIFFSSSSINYLDLPLQLGEIYKVDKDTKPLYMKDGYISCNETFCLGNDIKVKYLGSDNSACIYGSGLVGGEKSFEIFEFLKTV